MKNKAEAPFFVHRLLAPADAQLIQAERLTGSGSRRGDAGLRGDNYPPESEGRQAPADADARTTAPWCLVVVGKAHEMAALRRELRSWPQPSFVLCADSGQLVARELGVTPDAYLGDFDSSTIPPGERHELSGAAAILGLPPQARAALVMAGARRHAANSAAGAEGNSVAGASEISAASAQENNAAGGSETSAASAEEPSFVPPVFVLPAEKDMTDSEAAVDVAVQLGFTRIAVLGGLAGRLDHTLGNLALLAKYLDRGVQLTFRDGVNAVTMVAPGEYELIGDSAHKYLGVLAYGGAAQGVTLAGTKYPLTDFLLGDAATLGVSNEIVAPRARVGVREGRLLLILSRD